MKAFGSVLGLVLTAAIASPAHSREANAEYPVKQIRLVVPFAAGGIADIFARLVANHLQQSLDRPVIVDNRPGAGALLGAVEVAKSPADGSTLLLMTNTHDIQEALDAPRGYVLMRDLAPVASIYDSELVLVATKDLEANTVAELIALGKAKPNYLNFSSTGIGTSLHLAGEMFKLATGIDMMHVPYKNGTNARMDMQRGDIKLMFDVGTSAKADISGGQIKGLATAGANRSPFLPELPTIKEAGVPNFTVSLWAGIMAPAGTPTAVLDRLNTDISTYLRTDAAKEIFFKRSASPLVMTREEFGQFITRDIAMWTDLVKATRIKLD